MNNVLDYLKIQAECLPDKTAFADESTSVTFKGLLDYAEIIGSELMRNDCRKMPVPLLMEKSVLTIEIMMGVVCSNGFYIILDPSQPPARLDSILETLQAKVLVTTRKHSELISKLSYSEKVLEAEELVNGEKNASALLEAEREHFDTDPLYVLFTSGSTGVPKGVVVSHRSVIDFIGEFTRLFDINEEDVLGNQAPFDFDVSVKDIYSGLATGASVQLIPKEYFYVPVKLIDFLEDRGVTNLTWAVSALTIVSIFDGLSYKCPDKIKRVMFSGETMPVKHLNYWRTYYPNARFVNLYGPTEITCNCTYYEIEKAFSVGERIPIGQPFPNEKVFLLDGEGKEVTKPGMEGEICVSGTALSLGYYNNPEQTEKAFVQNPLNDKWAETIYKTGDLAYYDESGDLYFASRKDFQIKHMGHRIELGEIENALEKVEAIKRTCCLFDENRNKIVCFYQGDIGKKEIVSEVRGYLQDFMIPNVFRQLDELPITTNGKIDRKMLKQML